MQKCFLLGIIVINLVACGQGISAPVTDVTITATPVVVAVPTRPSLLSWNVPILMYHHIGTAPAGADKIRQNLTVSTETFKRQLDFIKEKKYQAITFADIDNYSEHGIPLPSKPIIISLDDGYDDNYANAFPVLQANGMRAVFYIITDKVGAEGYMSWQQVKELRSANHEIGSHTRTHPDLAVISVSQQKLKDEIVNAKKILEDQQLGPVFSFAYPSGKYNAAVTVLAGEAYKFSRTTHRGIFNEATKSTEIPTLRISEGSDLEGLLP